MSRNKKILATKNTVSLQARIVEFNSSVRWRSKCTNVESLKLLNSNFQYNTGLPKNLDSGKTWSYTFKVKKLKFEKLWKKDLEFLHEISISV